MSSTPEHPSLTFNKLHNELHIDEHYAPCPFTRTRLTNDEFIQQLLRADSPPTLLPQVVVTWVGDNYRDWLADVCGHLDAQNHKLHLRSLHLHPTSARLPFHRFLQCVARCEEVTLLMDATVISQQSLDSQYMQNADLVYQHLSTADIRHLTLQYSHYINAPPTITNTLLQSLFHTATTLQSIELPQSLLISPSYKTLFNALTGCTSIRHLAFSGINILCTSLHDQQNDLLFAHLLQLLNSSLQQQLLSLKFHLCTADEYAVVKELCRSICSMRRLMKLHITTSRRFNQLRPSPPKVALPVSVRLLQLGTQHLSGSLQDLTLEFDKISLDNDIRVFGRERVKRQIVDTIHSWTNIFYATIRTNLFNTADVQMVELVTHRNRLAYKDTIDTVLDVYEIHEASIRELIYEYVFIRVDEKLRSAGNTAHASPLLTDITPPFTPSPPTQRPMFDSEMLLSERKIDVF